MENSSYFIIYALYFVMLIAVSVYVYRLRKAIDEMHGMMAGMTFGMIAGLATATIFLIPTGNFLYGVIIGSVVGLIFGVLFGKLGGHLGILEGIVAGPMGGMMGAMLGQMVRPFNIELFIPFFTFIFLITLMGITYTVNCGANCCDAGKEKKSKVNISKEFILVWLIAFIVLLSISIFLSFSLEERTNLRNLVSQNTLQTNSVLPPFFQELMKEEKNETKLRDNYQEIDLRITSSKYSPNVIVAKKNILLRINIRADETAGCAREIVFPDFNIDKIVPAGGKETIEFTPTKEGTFKFRCSMDMVRGKLIIE